MPSAKSPFSVVVCIESCFVKILVLSQYWYPENGVPQRRWAWLTEILKAAGHDVLVVAPPPHYQRRISVKQWALKRGFRADKHSEQGPSGERIVRSGFFPASNSLTQRVLNQASVAVSMATMHLHPRSLVRRYEPDLVIGTVPALPTSVLTQLVAKIHHVPYIVDLRDAWPDLLQESRSWNEATGQKTLREKVLSLGPLQILTSITGRAMNSALRKSAGVISTSERLEKYLASSFSKHSGMDIPELATVRNVFPSLSPVAKTGRAGNPNEFHVLYAGTLGRAQKLDNALQAMKLAQESGLNIKFKMVGDGATWNALHNIARQLELDIEFYPRGKAEELTKFYSWADTALVHLTDWEPLKRAIPSKTYELMEHGIHISGVVDGEAADLMEKLNAGHVVSPEDPQALAALWKELSENRQKLEVSGEGKRWVQEQRTTEAPENLLQIVDRVLQKSRNFGN